MSINHSQRQARENTEVLPLSNSSLPCSYRIRISSRAKYLGLNVSLEKGLEVVVPSAMSDNEQALQIPQFVEENRHWIDASFAKLNSEKAQAIRPDPCLLPQSIALPAIAQVFSVTYQAQPIHQKASLTLEQKERFELLITGDIGNKSAVFELLERFFKDYAKYYLQVKLDHLSEQANLPYRRLTVRAQKTRLGSCSAKKNINLNYRLLFLEEVLLDYVLLHELVHTIHMNHSELFWQYLNHLMPDARTWDKVLDKAVKDLPCWVFRR